MSQLDSNKECPKEYTISALGIAPVAQLQQPRRITGYASLHYQTSGRKGCKKISYPVNQILLDSQVYTYTASRFSMILQGGICIATFLGDGALNITIKNPKERSHR